ncbi:inorganic phosphate transporter, partial [Escherichia coli]|uniref:inorganic phosphate transporter n=1 Tax=Escherichia coli TaxID=562 RepID=UPI0013D7F728
HMTYAMGASAELVAAGTILAADRFGLPVSTTHILSSGVAGASVASGAGLQARTVRNLALAWLLTLPAAMLLSGGIGAIVGALAWRSFSDAWGRKKLLVAGTFICAAGSGAIALVPDGNWLLFSVLRFVVGVGLAACAT